MRSIGALRSQLTLIVVTALLFATAACGASPAQENEVATGGSRFSTADEETAKLGSDAEPGVFPRTVRHAKGETKLERKPERVVVLDGGELDAVLNLGITPVGMATNEGASPLPSYLTDKVSGIKTVGSINQLNLEAIAALKPDLILGSQLRADKQYATLAEIAPTVFSIRPGFPWKENFLLIGDALGMENEAVAALNAYADAVAALKEKVTGDPKISLVRFMPGRLRLYGNKSLIGVILTDAGLARPEKQNIDELAVQISEENIGDADGDVIFYTSYGQPNATGETLVTSLAGWKNLSAVKAGKAYRVDDDVWYLGLGPTGAGIIVEQLTGFLVPQ